MKNLLFVLAVVALSMTSCRTKPDANKAKVSVAKEAVAEKKSECKTSCEGCHSSCKQEDADKKEATKTEEAHGHDHSHGHDHGHSHDH